MAISIENNGAISIEELIGENLDLTYGFDHCIDDMNIKKINDNYFLATLDVRDEDNIKVSITVNDEEEITEIEEL